METKEQKIERLKKEIKSARDTLGTVECDNFGYIGQNLRYNLPIRIARLEQELKELEDERKQDRTDR